MNRSRAPFTFGLVLGFVAQATAGEPSGPDRGGRHCRA